MPTQAKEIKLVAANPISEHSDYYFELLQRSFNLIGYQLTIDKLDGIPQQRVAKWLDDGEISLHWFIQTKERDNRYTPVRLDITNKIVGQRVLLILKGAQQEYAQVNSVADFKALNKVAGFGKGWFDSQVWQLNQLPFHETISWQNIFPMIEKKNRGIDYISRGINQVFDVLDQYPNLALEQHLLLKYDRDFRFYLSKQAAHYQPLFERALIKAKETGLIDQLIKKHWSSYFDKLDYSNRVQLQLETPIR